MSEKKAKLIRPLAGMRDLLPDEVETRGRVVELAREVFRKWGYRRIITPTLESYGALGLGLSPSLLKRSFKFFDSQGKLLLLRPDMTTPIARVVATRLKDAPKPIKVSYTASVYREQPRGAGRDQEFYQMGIESIGVAGSAIDAEILLVMIDLLLKIRLKNFFLVLGHADVVKGLLEEFYFPEKMRQDILQALAQQNFVRVKELLFSSKLAKPVHRFFELIQLKGTFSILSQAEKLVQNKQAKAAIAYLAEIGTILKKKKQDKTVLLDFSLIKDLEYYTGFLCEGVVRGVGLPLGSGGRYDHLLAAYGAPLPATGFALNLERLLQAMEA